MAKLVKVRNLMREGLPLPVKRNGKMEVEMIPRGRSKTLPESELLPDAYTKQQRKQLKIVPVN